MRMFDAGSAGYGMNWLYVQRTGHLYRPDGSLLTTAYAGHGAGVNQPALQDQIGIGPLPTGLYTIGTNRPGTHMGPIAIALLPDAANQMHGRAEFYCHLDTRTRDHSASAGCIVMGVGPLAQIAQARGQKIEVVAEEPVPSAAVTG